MIKNSFLPLLVMAAAFGQGCSSNSSILPNTIKGTYQGTWSGMGNSGSFTLHDLQQTDDPDSDYDNVEGSITMLSLKNKTITSGQYNPTGNLLTIKVSDGANQYTFIASHKASERSFSSNLLTSGNSGSWKAEKN